MYCRKEMVKSLKCYLIPKKSYGSLSKVTIFFGQPCMYISKDFIFILDNCYTKRLNQQATQDHRMLRKNYSFH